MPSSLLAYSGIVTKTKAISSRLITLEDYNKISQLESTVDFVTFLKSQPGYANFFANVDEHTLHRGQIEHILVHSLYYDYAKLFQFSNKKQRNALSLIFFRYEVNILKSCMQHAFRKKIALDLSLFTEFFNKHSKLDINDLVTASTIEEFIYKLKDTPYYLFFNHLQTTSALNVYDYEMQLDIYYFKRVWELKDKLLKGSERKAITHIIGSQIDLLNIMWIYRSKKHYNIDSSKIYASIIPVHYKLKSSYLSKLVEAENVEAILSILNTTYYRNVTSEYYEGSMELAYQRIMNQIFKKYERIYPASIAPIYSFLHLKEQEIDKLTTALECIRYNLDSKETLKYVLH